jgi:hypothetical protein
LTALGPSVEYEHSRGKEGLIPGASLVLVPLDDRPCNRQFPQQLAAIAGVEVAAPPRELLGRFLDAGDSEAIAEWLRQQRSDRFVLSLDMLCFGGLIASRRLDVNAACAVARLETLRRVRERNPDARVLAFSTIMRLGTTVAGAGDLNQHGLLRGYSQLVDRVDRLGEVAARAELRGMQERLDPAVLEEYLSTRRRNHAVNRAAVELAADGVVHYVVLAQEDAAPVGIHIPEQLALRSQVAEFRVAERVAMMCGADEMGALLTARACSDDRSLPVAVRYATEEGAQVVPAFETESVRAMTERHLAAAGAQSVEPGQAEAMLLVHTPVGVQKDLAEEAPSAPAPTLARQADNLAEELEVASTGGLVVGLADVAYCNGADPELVRALKGRGLPGRLAAFAGWNTAANTVGTAVSQLCLAGQIAAAQGCHPPRGRDFVAARLIDDYGYQTCVRPKAMARAAELEADPFALGEAADQVEGFVREQLAPIADEFCATVREDSRVPKVSISLPWGRLFEVEVEITE